MKAFAYLAELALALLFLPAVRALRLLGWRPARASIVGWWGSETIGDIAILGQLLTECRAIAATAPLDVVSFDARVTRATLRMLGYRDVRCLPLGVLSAWALVASRCIIVGGGPLMESPSMRFWAWRHRLVRAAGGRVLLYANGIGPVRSAGGAETIVSILHNASHVVLRDSTSVAWSAVHAKRTDAVLSFDPAFDFVRTLHTPGLTRRRQLALALRSPSVPYLDGVEEGLATEQFLEVLAAALNHISATTDLRFVGLVMHDGSDDAAMYARLRRKLSDPARLHVPENQDVTAIVRLLESSQAALTVRFHAMIFALATDTPFVAIDYARPQGKVTAAAIDVRCGDAVLAWDTVTESALRMGLQRALDAGGASSRDVSAASSARRAVLGAALA